MIKTCFEHCSQTHKFCKVVCLIWRHFAINDDFTTGYTGYGLMVCLCMPAHVSWIICPTCRSVRGMNFRVKNLLKKYVHPHGMSWFCSAEFQCWSKAFDLWVDGPHAVKSFGFAWEYGTSVNPLVDYHFPVFKFGPFLGIYSFFQTTRTYCRVYIPLFTFVYLYIHIFIYLQVIALSRPGLCKVVWKSCARWVWDISCTTFILGVVGSDCLFCMCPRDIGRCWCVQIWFQDLPGFCHSLQGYALTSKSYYMLHI